MDLNVINCVLIIKDDGSNVTFFVLIILLGTQLVFHQNKNLNLVFILSLSYIFLLFSIITLSQF